MKKVTLFIAMSLDGYIADKDGNVNWLHGQNSESEDMTSYFEFIKDIDTVIMGWNTYNQIITELSPEEWVYNNLISYVITHREILSTNNIKFVSENVCKLIKTLRQGSGKDIWICGGANIIQPLIKENLIDIFHISIIPIILGNGIALFKTIDTQIKLRLIKTQSYNGITDVIYECR